MAVKSRQMLNNVFHKRKIEITTVHLTFKRTSFIFEMQFFVVYSALTEKTISRYHL